jgi:hypothetical protein
MWRMRIFIHSRLGLWPIRINGLPLPRDLIVLIEAGRWRCPADLTGVDRLFPDRGEFKLYRLDYMPFENSHWVNQREPMMLGAPDPVKSPGDIDPKLSVLIGDLGLGREQPIALDYRQSVKDPPILTLEWSKSGRDNRWITVANNITVFADLVRL